MFRDFKILEEILYYDGPLIFTIENEYGHFLAYSVNWERLPTIGARETILMFQGTREELEPVLTNKISIRKFMKSHPIVYSSIWELGSFKSAELLTEIPEIYIPEEGVFLRGD